MRQMVRRDLKLRRTALVTGGAQRVGRAIVERLAASGFDVIFTYRSSGDAARKLAGKLNNTRRWCTAIKVDLENLQEFEKPLRTAVEKLGSLDVLVNNASLYEPDPQTLDRAFADRIFAVNVAAPVALIEWFAPALRAANGHVVNMLDILAEKPWPQYATYCASKAALQNHTLSFARALAPEVTVNGIAPGVVAWPDGYPEEERQKYLKRVPLGRPGTPEDVANLVHFLVTEGAYITGQVIRLDGGRSIT